MTTNEKLPVETPLTSKTNLYPKNESKQFCNGKESFCNATSFERSDETKGKYLIAPFGDWKNGNFIQRIDNICGENLCRNMKKVWTRVKNTFGNACPVFYEHPDNEDAQENPDNADKTPYGKVLSLEILANGIYANIEWLKGFSELPHRLQISPRWNTDIVSGNIVRPMRLLSLGLTKNPNIKDTSFVNSTTQQKEIYMDKEILQLLGYSDEDAQKIIDKTEDAPNDVFDRIKNALKASSQSELESVKKELDSTKTELANSKQALAASQESRAKLIVANAVRDGKITQAQSDTAVKILQNAENFEEEADKLANQQAIVKTTPASDGIEKGEKAKIKSKLDAQNEFQKLVEEKESKGFSRADAWNSVKSEKADLFKTAFGED